MKNKIRNEKKLLRQNMSKELVSLKSTLINDKLLSLSLYRDAKIILAYFPIQNEVDIRNILEDALINGKRVFLPRISDDKENMDFFEIRDFNHFERGSMNLLEPKKSGDIFSKDMEDVLMIIPGLAFDKHFNRIGYGKGYYDKYLSKNPIKNHLAVSYEEQFCDIIPSEENDILMNVIVTEKNIYYRG